MSKDSLINKNYDDCYFSIESGYLESEYVFVDGNNIKERKSSSLNIGETGFGTGLNLLVLEDSLIELGKRDFKLTFTSVEKYILEPDVIKTTLKELNEVSKESLFSHLELYQLLYKNIKKGWNSLVVNRTWGELTINLFYGDVLCSFSDYPLINDVWFLDGHSPDKNPEMWNSKVFNFIALNSKKNTTFSTFTAAGVVKSGLRDAGFFVKRKKGFGKKRHMILGSF